MRLNEFIKGGRTPIISGFASNSLPGKTYPASQMGASRFGYDIFNLSRRTPHWEMREIIEIMETRPQVASGLKQIVRFIIGNDIFTESSSPESDKYMEDWIEGRPDLYSKVFRFALLAIAMGNTYIEPLFKLDSYGKKRFDNIDIIPDPSRMYRYLNKDMNDDENYWVYEVPLEVKWFEGYQPKFFKINYVKGGILFQQSVYGVPYNKKHFDHFKMGWSRDGLYGRGYLASTIDDNNILKEILKNIAIIARYRALNTKLITPSSEDQELIEDDIEYIEAKLLNKRDEEHLVLNKALRVEALSNTNEYDTMNAEIDFLRRDINSGLVPNFITPWDSEVNRATAGESKIPFSLELESMEREIINFLNRSILDRLRKDGAPIADDATFKFGAVNMESYDTMVNVAMNLFSQGGISFNELRKTAGFETVEGGDKFAWEIQSSSGSSIFDSISGKPKKMPQVTTKSSLQEKINDLKERHFTTQIDKKPRTRVCQNCKHFLPNKRFCKLNNWPCESTDSCGRFEKKDIEEKLTKLKESFREDINVGDYVKLKNPQNYDRDYGKMKVKKIGWNGISNIVELEIKGHPNVTLSILDVKKV